MKGALRLLPLLAILAVTRLVALGTLPIFLDETIHLRWAFNIAQGDKLFRPWADGRLLTIWLYAAVVPHVDDFLVWARALSAAAGAVTLVGLFALGRRIASPACGVVAALLYLVCPFTLFYDRLALTDSFLAAAATVTLLLSLGAFETPAPWRAVLLGVVLALSVLVKFSGILLFLIPAASALFLGGRGAVRSLATAYGVALLLLLYPLVLFAGTDMLKVVAVQAREEGLMRDAFANLGLIGQYLGYYWGGGMVLLGVVGAVFAVGRREGRLLLVLTLLPLVVVAVVLRVWYARYILWETVPFLLLCGLGVARLLERRRPLVAGLLLAAAILPVLPRDLRLVLAPPAAGLPPGEDAQYVNGWPSGYGVRETVGVLQEALRQSPGGIAVVTHSASHRTLWNAFDLYFQDETVFHNEALDLSDPDAVPWLLRGGFGALPTYVVLAPRSEGAHKATVTRDALERVATRVSTFRYPDGSVASEIYRLPPVGAPSGQAPATRPEDDPAHRSPQR